MSQVGIWLQTHQEALLWSLLLQLRNKCLNNLLQIMILAILHSWPHDTHTYTGQCLALHNLQLLYDLAITLRKYFSTYFSWCKDICHVAESLHLFTSAPPCQMCTGGAVHAPCVTCISHLYLCVCVIQALNFTSLVNSFNITQQKRKKYIPLDLQGAYPRYEIHTSVFAANCSKK